ncbi:hypothetical protein GCM10011607_28780 [Shewanella inventionis]|uniref:Uncharacterized protein n=1 Tax=Shewanella inventionis TaxID=1738770 RepID=A0ABQ1JHU1_9GAMM|nr:hypothetical protein [Shewanella inventionis]GGB66369.1 hypothetical protein GCM10011607_28780 [Shewanella inventionis]
MTIEHAELLKLWLVHQKRLTKLLDVQRNLESLMAHYKLECIQKSNKSISTLSLINDAVTEMEDLLAQDFTMDEITLTQATLTDDTPSQHQQQAEQMQQRTMNSKPASLEEKLAMLNAGGVTDVRSKVTHNHFGKQNGSTNPPDDLSNAIRSSF